MIILLVPSEVDIKYHVLTVSNIDLQMLIKRINGTI